MKVMTERSTLTTRNLPTSTPTGTDNPLDFPSTADHSSGEQSSRHDRIAAEAYLIAAQRGFTPGHDLDDWLAAETHVESERRALPTVASNG